MRLGIGTVVCLFGPLAAGTNAADDATGSSARVVVSSPDGRVRAEVFLDRGEGQGPAPRYTVSFRGRPVVLPSPLGVDLAEGEPLGSGSTIEGVVTRSVRETYRQFPGKRLRVDNRCAEAVISLRERGAPARRWELHVRAYDDGAAFRYRFPAQEGWTRLAVAGERTGFRLPDDAVAHALRLDGFTTSHEGRYSTTPVAAVPADWLLGLPLLVEIPGTGWAAVAEANLTDYAGLYLARDRGRVRGSWPGFPPCPGSRRSPSGPTCRTNRPGGS